MGSGECMTDRAATNGLEGDNVKRPNQSGIRASDRGFSRITLALGVAIATAMALVTIASPFGRGGTVGAQPSSFLELEASSNVRFDSSPGASFDWANSGPTLTHPTAGV